jgi:hypothetical protein
VRIVTYNKKLLILIIAILLLLLSLVAVFLYYKDSFSSSRDADIYSLCEKSVEEGKSTYTCKAFLRDRLDKGFEECFVLDVVSGSSIVGKTLCERKGYVQWNKEEIYWGDTEGAVIPINIIFSERLNLPIKNFNLFEITIKRLEDKELSPIINNLDPIYNVGNIITNEMQRVEKNGYTTAFDKKMELGYVYIQTISLKEIVMEDDLLLVKFSTLFKGEEKDFTVKTSQFSYRESPYVNEDGPIPVLVNVSNYMNYPSNTDLSISLIYIPTSSSLLQRDLDSICADEDQAIYPVCFYLSIIKTDIKAVVDVDETLAEIADGDGFLESFILVSMSKND